MIGFAWRRARADLPVVLATVVTVLVAITVVTAAPMYAAAVTDAGLARRLADAPPSTAGIEVVTRGEPGAAADLAATVEDAVTRRLGGVTDDPVSTVTGPGFVVTPGPDHGGAAEGVATEGVATTVVVAEWLGTAVDVSVGRLPGGRPADRVGLGDRGRVSTAIDALEADLAAAGTGAEVVTELPGVLADAGVTATATRTTVLVTAAQLVVVALLAVTLLAGLTVDARRVEDALVVARGAGRRQLAAAASVEAALVVVPPWPSPRGSPRRASWRPRVSGRSDSSA